MAFMPRSHLAAALGAALVALALVAFAALTAPSPAAAQQAKALGKTSRTPAPACPRNTREDPCEAVGSVTGFQIAGQGKRGLMRAPENGWLVAWSIVLSRPTAAQQQFFGEFYEHSRFGQAPHARIALLRSEGNGRFTLMRQSPVVDLSAALGEQYMFTLNRPLRIRRGMLLALTIPTWSSSFAVNLAANGNRWRASRQKGKCAGAQNIQEGTPHMAQGTTRRYACTYRTARLLYWGHYVAD